MKCIIGITRCYGHACARQMSAWRRVRVTPLLSTTFRWPTRHDSRHVVVREWAHSHRYYDGVNYAETQQ